jgi:hypothetical protein
MKKLIVFSIALLGFAYLSTAQEVGIRWGNNIGGSAAVDGVFSYGDFSRIHAEVSFGEGLGLEALWNFHNAPMKSEALYWYAGAGVYTFLGDPFVLGVSGELGLEYRYNGVPLVFGADWRPSLDLISTTYFWPDRFGMNLRWNFAR